VIKRSRERLTYRSNGKDLEYFNIIAAFINDSGGNEYVTIRSYLFDFDRIVIGNTYRFENTVRKTDQLWAIKGSQTARVKDLEGDFDTDIKLPEEDPECGLVRSLPDAIKTSRRSVVAGKICKVLIKYVAISSLMQLSVSGEVWSENLGHTKVTQIYFEPLVVHYVKNMLLIFQVLKRMC